jgi:hypothetical protein
MRERGGKEQETGLVTSSQGKSREEWGEVKKRGREEASYRL